MALKKAAEGLDQHVHGNYTTVNSLGSSHVPNGHPLLDFSSIGPGRPLVCPCPCLPSSVPGSRACWLIDASILSCLNALLPQCSPASMLSCLYQTLGWIRITALAWQVRVRPDRGGRTGLGMNGNSAHNGACRVVEPPRLCSSTVLKAMGMKKIFVCVCVCVLVCVFVPSSERRTAKLWKP